MQHSSIGILYLRAEHVQFGIDGGVSQSPERFYRFTWCQDPSFNVSTQPAICDGDDSNGDPITNHFLQQFG